MTTTMRVRGNDVDTADGYLELSERLQRKDEERGKKVKDLDDQIDESNARLDEIVEKRNAVQVKAEAVQLLLGLENKQDGLAEALKLVMGEGGGG